MAEVVDPFVSFRFKVEIQGVIEAGCAEVSGLNLEVDTEDYDEGGVNDYVHKLPKAAKWPNLTLKRGLTDDVKLWDWARKCIDGKFEKKTINIILVDEEDATQWQWTVENAYPVKWTGPEFKATSAEIAFEAMEFVHTGIKKS
ncbi:MAG: phage tail protein [bacterium]|nr:phage tail protein [bacterium]